MPKTLILVGMGPGNGAALARKFGKEGYKIYMIGRTEEKLAKFKKELEAEKIKADYKVANAGDEEHFRLAFKHIFLEDESPDVLIYNASVLKPRIPSRLIPDHVVRDFRTNVVGAIIAAQEVLPSMKKKKKGTILFTGGGLSINPHFEYSSLAIGKAALRNFTFSLEQEYKDYGIHVATITINGMVKKGTKFDPEKIAEEFWKLHNQKEKDWETEIIFE
ncbi:MAG: SDR family NAD(P)-dependent oxidoreductase [Cytophagales bacterium]